MKRNAPEIIDTMISMGLIETIGGKIVNTHPQYHVHESALDEEAQSGDREAYKKFFNAALKRFGADSVADMDDDKKKEFFTYVDKNWESEDEKNESVQIDEKVNMKDLKDTIKKYNDLDHRSAFHYPKKKSVSVDGRGMNYDAAMEKMKSILGESYIDEKTVPVNLPDDTWLKIVKTNNPQEDIVQMIDFRYGYEEVEGEKLKVSKMKNGLVHIEASGGDFAIAEIITPQQAKRLSR